jgi:hypothetical protein
VSTLRKRPHAHLKIDLTAKDGVNSQHVPSRLGRVSRMSMEPQRAPGSDDNGPAAGLLRGSKRPHGQQVNALLRGNGIEMNELVQQRLMAGNDDDCNVFGPAVRAVKLSDAAVIFGPGGSISSRHSDGDENIDRRRADDLEAAQSGGLRSGSNRRRVQLEDEDEAANPSLARSAATGRGSMRFGAQPSRNYRVVGGSRRDQARSEAGFIEGGDEAGGQQVDGQPGVLQGGALSWIGSRGKSSGIDQRAGADIQRAGHAQFGFSNPLSPSSIDGASLQASKESMNLLGGRPSASRSAVASLFNFIGSPSARPSVGGTQVDGGSQTSHPILTPSDYKAFQLDLMADEASEPRYNRSKRDSVGASLGLDDEHPSSGSLAVAEGNDGSRPSFFLRTLGVSSRNSGLASSRPSAAVPGSSSGTIQSQIFSGGSAVSVTSRMRPSLFRVANPIGAIRAEGSTMTGLISEGRGSTDAGNAAESSPRFSLATNSLTRMLSTSLLGARSSSSGPSSSLDSSGRRVSIEGPASALALRSLSSSMREDSTKIASGVQRPRGYRAASSKASLAEQLGASPSVRAMMIKNKSGSGGSATPTPPITILPSASSH